MTEEKKTEKRVTVFNQGTRMFRAPSGEIHPKGSLEVGESEAEMLLSYPDIIDLSKMSPKTAENLDSLRAENASLKAEVEKLKAQVAKLDAPKEAKKK